MAFTDNQEICPKNTGSFASQEATKGAADNPIGARFVNSVAARE